MLSRLQWEVSQAQWSDLCCDYTFGFGYRGCIYWSNYKQHSIAQCSLAASIFLMLGLGNATN